jgi:hypothetical protein
MKKKRPTVGTHMSAGARSALACTKGEQDHNCDVHDQRNKQLLLSFWDICLDNLPEGMFSHRCIPGHEATSLITHARQANQLLCVSNDDLLAPYKKEEAQRHKQLCAVLGKQFGIKLSIRDFIASFEHDGEPLYSITPLQCVQLGAENRLLVVTCGYTVSKEKGESLLNPGIAPETITFHLIEAS